MAFELRMVDANDCEIDEVGELIVSSDARKTLISGLIGIQRKP
jgi:hypothetical protein